MKGDYDRVILGRDAIYTTDCEVTGINNNILVCGGSGSGKTMSISEPCMLEAMNSSLVVTVTKRRIVDKYKQLFRSRGYVVEDMNYIDPEESTVSFDPIRYIKDCTDITYVARSIMLANPQKQGSSRDPYWDEAAASLLCAEISYVIMTNEKATFADVIDAHMRLKIAPDDEGIKTTLDDEFEEIRKEYPGSFAIDNWKTFCILPRTTAGCVLGTLTSALNAVFTPELCEMIRDIPPVDFKGLAQRKTVLFVSTSAVNPVLHNYVNIFYARMFRELFEFAEKRPDGRLPVPTRIICDDFATGSRIMNFPEYISVFREGGISVTLLVQSESQLEKIYGSNDATTIINNCDTYIYLGGMDINTAKHISERLDAPLNDVLNMPIGREFIFRRGQKPIVTQRYDIRSNTLYNEITDRRGGRYEKRNI